MAIAVEGDFAGVPARQHLRFGARADPAHLTLQYVPDLGQLVDPRAAQEAADARDPVVIVAGHRGASPVTRIARCNHPHRAKLDHHDRRAGMADPLLPEQHRPAVVQLDRHRDD